MDALALFAIPFLMAVGAHQATLAQQYTAAAQYGQPYTYVVPPGSGWAPGAAIGAGVGALASGGSAGATLAGALIGGGIGYAETTPPAYVNPTAYQPAYVAPTGYPQLMFAGTLPRSAPARSGDSDEFIRNWMNFMQPTTR